MGKRKGRRGRRGREVRTGAALPEDGRVRADLDDSVTRDRACASKRISYYQKRIAFERKKKGREFSDVPEMMTIFLESPDTAEVSASRVVTVVVEPPTPPVVLHGSGIRSTSR